MNLVRLNRGSRYTARNDISRLFDDFFDGFLVPFNEESDQPIIADFSPRINISETEKEVKVTAELPGLTEKDINIELDDDVLSIKGEKKDSREKEEESWHSSEARYGKFERTIQIPVKVDAKKVKAAYKNGLLTVALPKVAEEQAKKHKIEIAA